jgi:hypothetical protein
MKSATEEFCRSKFDEFLRRQSPSVSLKWHEVLQQDEPPDYYLELGEAKYAVEVTTLMESVSVGSTSIPQAAVVQSLWHFVDEVEQFARQGGYLKGTYVVGFLKPIDNFRVVREQIRDALLEYVKDTQDEDSAPEKAVFRRGAERCSIKKVHSLADKFHKAGPTDFKWEGEVASQICTLLDERLADKVDKLRTVVGPRILLLYDSYHFASLELYRQCVGRLPHVTFFHTVFIVQGENTGIVLHSENDEWR